MPRAPGQRQGRTRTTGTEKAPKRILRVDVSYRFKRDVITFYAAPNTMNATVRKFFPLLSLLNVELLKVPPGYTFACRPADIAWNKSVKDRLRANWGQQMLQQLRAFVPGTPFELTAPSRLELITWLKAAWGSLSTAAVINGFRKAKILQHGGSRVLDAPLASLPSQPELEEEGTDWEQLFDLVRKHSMERMVLVGGATDPSRDIETLEASVEY